MTDIDEVKSRVNIVDIISERIPLKKAGRHFKAICPFHAEKTPSFVVSPDRQIWKCFGCGRGGSAIDFIMEYDHMDFVEALETLALRVGVKLDHTTFDTPETKLKQKLYEVNHLASEFYHFLLTKHALGVNAREYLKSRGVKEKTITTFMLGYSPNSWDGLLKYLLKKGYEGELLEKAGLVVRTQNSMTRNQLRFYDRFRGRVMFTLKDHRGNVVGFSGRLLDKETKEAKYINTSETPIYSKSNVLYGLDVTHDQIARANEAIVMEGELDVISSFQEGISNIVAIKGSALTQGHAHLLRRYAEKLLFALDSDMAGDAASRRGIEIAEKAGFDMKVVILPAGKDPDDIARETPEILKKAIKEAVPIYDYIINSATHQFDISTSFGKRKASELIFPTLAKIDNPIVLSHYLKKIALLFDTSIEVVQESLEKLIKAQQSPKTVVRTSDASAAHEPPSTRSDKLEVYLLALILQGKTVDWFEELEGSITIKDIRHPAVARALDLLKTFLNEHPVFLIKDFADSLPNELLPIVDEAFLWDISEILEDENRLSLEWTNTLANLERDIIKSQIRDISSKLGKRSETEKEDGIPLEDQLSTLTHKLKEVEKRIAS